MKERYTSKPQTNLRLFSMTFCANSEKHALFKLLTSWQNSLNRGGFVGPILMDLSKAYDCLKNDLLLAKLQA